MELTPRYVRSLAKLVIIPGDTLIPSRFFRASLQLLGKIAVRELFAKKMSTIALSA